MREPLNIPSSRPPALVVLPTYNEVENLAPLCRAIHARVPGAHLLIVDDASPDGTGDVAERLRAERPDAIETVHRQGKQGLGTAYVLGFRHALARGYPRVVTMDADLSHAPEHLPDILRVASTCDLVMGSRYVDGGRTVNWELRRKALSLAANAFTRRALGLAIRDCTSGFRCYSRQILETIDLDQIVADGYSFQIEMLWRCLRAGFRVQEIPIVFVERVFGTSKISRGEIAKAFSTVLALRRDEANDRRAARAPGEAGGGAGGGAGADGGR